MWTGNFPLSLLARGHSTGRNEAFSSRSTVYVYITICMHGSGMLIVSGEVHARTDTECVDMYLYISKAARGLRVSARADFWLP